MPRHEIHGRFCENPYCRAAIDPSRPKGTRFCDSSCRSEAWKVKTGELPKPTTAKALRGVAAKRGKRQREHVPRPPTPYCVMRKRLDLLDGERVLLGGFEIVGFAAETNKARAIRKVADGRDDVVPGDQFVAVSVKQLVMHLPDGTPAAELHAD